MKSPFEIFHAVIISWKQSLVMHLDEGCGLSTAVGANLRRNLNCVVLGRCRDNWWSLSRAIPCPALVEKNVGIGRADGISTYLRDVGVVVVVPLRGASLGESPSVCVVMTPRKPCERAGRQCGKEVSLSSQQHREAKVHTR